MRAHVTHGDPRVMSPTHVVVGPVLALPLLVVSPELAAVAALAAAAGGVVPDLDLLAGEHRKTLHRPFGYWVPTVPALAVAAVAPGPTTVAAAFGLLGAAVHSVQDWFGGGHELEPWEASSDRGVYLHPDERWLRPKRWIRYDGAPEDVVLAVLLGVPGLFLYGSPVREVVAGALAVAVFWGAVRKRVPEYVAPLVE